MKGRWYYIYIYIGVTIPFCPHCRNFAAKGNLCKKNTAEWRNLKRSEVLFMKRFSKVLAVVLALITVLMALPLSVFADAWLDVDVDNRPEGSTLTVTLDGKALVELLEKEGVSKDLISQVLANATLDKEGLLKVFTVEELFQIFPKEDILNNQVSSVG